MLLQSCGGGTAPDMTNTAEVPVVAGARPEAGDTGPETVASDIDTGAESKDEVSEAGGTANQAMESEEAVTVAVVQYKIIPAFPFAVPDDDVGEAPLSTDAKIAVPGQAVGQDSNDSIPLNDDREETDQPVFSSGSEHESERLAADGSGIESITDLIFLTGQSNAASLVTKYDAELDSPDERVFAYTDQGWRVADLHQFWDDGIPGNFSADNPDREPYNNIIFQVGKALASSADRRVGIVMLTAPGEGISHWDFDGLFYSRVRDHALAALNAVPHKASFDALVWMQGETDWLLHGTADPDVPDFESYQSEAYLNYYPRKLTELIASLRSDPWFGDRARFVCTETIKAALNTHLMALNTDGDSLTGCAAASDLAARQNDPQGNHFSAESLRVLGQRIANVYLEMQP